MRRHLVFILAALFGLSAAFAQTGDSAPKASAPALQKNAAPQRGVLYRVRYHGNTCYLFGTVHVGQAAFYPLEPQVTRALSDASKLVIEIDLRDTAAIQQAIMRHAIYPDGQTIDQHLSAASTARLKQALQSAGIPYESIARMKPWMAVDMLAMQEMAHNGYPTDEGLELYFLSVAKKQHKTVEELETAEYQFSLLDSMNDAQQEQYLMENLDDMADGTSSADDMALLDAWQHADSKAMEAALLDMQNEKSVSSEFLQHVLLDQRNPNMANKIETLLKNDKATFVAVGALHLLGEKGVPKLLQQRGYEVQKLY